MATTPTFDLTEFLLPSGNNVNYIYAIPLPLRIIPGTPASSRSKRTAAINNAYNERRLPLHIAHEPQLPSRMINALRTILQESTPVDAERLRSVWEFGYKLYEDKLLTTGTEAKLKQFSLKLSEFATACVDKIASPKSVVVEPEHKSTDGIVITDHALVWAPPNVTLPPLVLIEDKSIAVMGAHLGHLLSMPCDLFRSTSQTSWEGAPSIVAKVIGFL
jgi:hypothetical protein